VNESAVLYALSTIAQTCAALAAFVGAVGIFRLQRLHDERGRLESSVRASMFEIHGHNPAILAYTPSRIIEWFLKTEAETTPGQREGTVEAALPNIKALRDIPTKAAQSRGALITFEVSNLVVIGATLIGFNHVPALTASPPLTTALLWTIVFGTVLVTLSCVVIWTEG
jgi:hypothetical protein